MSSFRQAFSRLLFAAGFRVSSGIRFGTAVKGLRSADSAKASVIADARKSAGSWRKAQQVLNRSNHVYLRVVVINLGAFYVRADDERRGAA